MFLLALTFVPCSISIFSGVSVSIALFPFLLPPLFLILSCNAALGYGLIFSGDIS